MTLARSSRTVASDAGYSLAEFLISMGIMTVVMGATMGGLADIVKGNEGQYRVRIMDNTKGADCAYPAVDLLPDGTFVTTTYGHWTEGEAPYIVSVRFKLEELDAKLPKP